MSEVLYQDKLPDERVQAFTAIMEQYYDVVVQHIRRCFPNVQKTPEDIAQDTFLNVWRGIDGYNGDASIKIWLIGIARNKAIDATREQRRTPKVVGDLFEEIVPAGTSVDPAQAFESTETLDQVQKVLADLPDTQRVPFELSAIIGMSGQEITERLDISPGMVKWRTWQTRQAVREAGKLALSQEPLKDTSEQLVAT